MKATLEFDLPEDAGKHLAAVNGMKFYCALREIERTVRDYHKHGRSLPGCLKEIEDELIEAHLDEIEEAR